MLLIGLITVFSVESISLLILQLENEVQVDVLTTQYELAFKLTENWDSLKKKEYLKEICALITQKKIGFITKLMSFIY